MAKKTRHLDMNQLAKTIVDIVTREKEGKEKEPPSEEVKAAAAALGRLGGLKGGKARANSLSPKRRSEIAKKAAKARWGK